MFHHLALWTYNLFSVIGWMFSPFSVGGFIWSNTAMHFLVKIFVHVLETSRRKSPPSRTAGSKSMAFGQAFGENWKLAIEDSCAELSFTWWEVERRQAGCSWRRPEPGGCSRDKLEQRGFQATFLRENPQTLVTDGLLCVVVVGHGRAGETMLRKNFYLLFHIGNLPRCR